MLGLALAFVLLGPGATPGPDDRHEHPPHFDTVAAVTFDDALQLSQHTDATRLREETLQARRRADSKIPRMTQNPQWVFQPGARLQEESERGFAAQAQLTQSWNLRNPGRARRQAMRAETEALSAELRRRALLQRLDAARAWIDLHAAEQSLELAREELELAHKLVEQAQTAFDARVMTRADLAEARRYAADVDARVVELEGNVHDLGLELSLSAGLDPSTPVTTRGPFPEPILPDGPELERRLANVDDLPQVTTARLEAAAARARAVEARAQRGTQLSLGAAVMRDGPNSLIVPGGVGGTIPLFDRGQSETARAKTEAGMSLAQAEQEQRALRSELAQILHEVQHTRLVQSRIQTELLPTLDELVDARQAARSAGEATVFEVLAARRELMDARARLVQAQGELTWAEVVAWLYLAEIARGAEQESR